MKKSILITGVSGAGKSSLNIKLNETGYTSYDMEEIPGLFSMLDRRTGKPFTDYDHADLAKVTSLDWVCDTEKLDALIKNETSPLAFYCGNASDMETILPFFDSVVLLKIGPEATRHRLTTRTSNEFGRTSHIQDWIMTWKDQWDEEMEKKGAVVIDAHQSLDQIAKEVVEKVAGADTLANEAMDRGSNI
ncbi:MAG: hypothetical protein WCT45_01070 [Candidatus Paceibacterota bacterium]|jgi:dephospho-CoA kinase